MSRQSSMAAELKALRSEYAAAQLRCSTTIGQLHARNAELEAEVIRLRAAVVARDSALKWAREDRARLIAALPGLPGRVKLAARIEALGVRVQALLRQLLRLEAHVGASPGMEGGQRIEAGLSRQGEAASPPAPSVGRPPADIPTAPVEALPVAAEWDEDGAALEERLVEADLVICQTGCLSHKAYWRMQDHCRRHNKPCVLVAEPDAVRVIRIHQRQAPVMAEAGAPSCSDTGAEMDGMLDTTIPRITIENVDVDTAPGQRVVKPPISPPEGH